MLTIAATLALLGLLPPDHPLRLAGGRTLSAAVLACALRLPGATAGLRRAG
ncbi:hypothetical protein [Acidovorax sp.]|jgi:hypothetical protein|uniref:hypothetical protein n=1 Tax=Acidovorax sp. TaxID=1872122 RepID=UPI00391F3B40